MGRARARYRYANEQMILNQRNGSGSPPLAHSFLPHQGDKKGATLLHKLITPSQMALLVCGLTAAPSPYLYEHRQSCPGVTQAVSYESPLPPLLPESGQDWQEDIRALALPFSTPNPRLCGSTHTFLQPIDCLILLPGPGDTNRDIEEPPGGGKV